MSNSVATKVFWLFGWSVSIVGLVLQVLIYFLVPSSRQLAQKLLTQLSVARILYVLFEYITINVEIESRTLNDIAYGLYFQTDAVVVCCMFAFTRNIYDDITDVFAKKRSFVVLAAIIWSVTIPVGILTALTLELDLWTLVKNPNAEELIYFKNFYLAYDLVKFVILTVNLIAFCYIFKVAFERKERNSSVLKICVVFFVLVSISSTHVLTTDLLTLMLDDVPELSLAFAVVHSYQVVIITAVFVMITQNVCKISNEALTAQIVKKFVKETI